MDTDIVYLYKKSDTNDASELKYSLRSLKNIPHRNVFIVGEKPTWLKNVIHIPTVQNSTKQMNVFRNLQTVAHTASLSDDFILMNDDFFIMRPLDTLPVYHWGPMQDIIAMFAKKFDASSAYLREMKLLHQLLISRSHPEPLSYELHVPITLNKVNIQKLHQPGFGPIYQFRSMYGNTFQIGGKQIEDVKIYPENRYNEQDYRRGPHRYLESQALLSATATSFDKGRVGTFIRNKFTEKSPYES